jgi:hypothetical protein
MASERVSEQAFVGVSALLFLIWCAVLSAFAWPSGKCGALPTQITKTNPRDGLTDASRI